MSDIKIRPISQDEFREASSIILDQHKWPFIQPDLDVLVGSPSSNFVAATDASTGSLCGFINLVIFPALSSPDDKRGYIGCLIVKDEYQRNGIGKKLLQWSFDKCRETRCTTVWLSATDAGAPLYASLGFQTTGRSAVYVKSGPAWSAGDAVREQPLEAASKLIWASVKTMKRDRAQLWREATNMINKSLDDDRTSLVDAYLDDATVFFLASSDDDGGGEVRVQAVLVSRPGYRSRQLLGPICARSGEGAQLLFQTVTTAGDAGSSGGADTVVFAIASDTRYDGGAFDGFLGQAGGAAEEWTLKIMEMPMGAGTVAKAPTDVKQLALIDLSFD